MAVGLNFLGRGRARPIFSLWAIHVAGAALAGAAFGGVLGWLGGLAGLAAWRPWVVGGAALLALALAARQPLQLGRQKQVPRRWRPGTSPRRAYAIWGLMLGCGVATPIFHAAFVLLGGAQLTAGVALGAATGAAFGGTRQVTALLPTLLRLDAERTTNLLETLRPLVRRLDVAVVLAAGIVLALVG